MVHCDQNMMGMVSSNAHVCCNVHTISDTEGSKMCPEQQLEQAGWIIEKVSGCCYGRGTCPFMQILLMRLCSKQEVDHVSHLSSVSHLQLHHWMLAKGGLLHLHVICFWLWVFCHISVSVFNLDDSVNTDLWPESPASEFKQKTFFFISLVFFI